MDAVDHRLAELLQRNGRATQLELSKAVGLSQPAVAERIRKLEERGIITGYAARIDAAQLGIDITAFIGVGIEHPKFFESFTKKVRALDEVLECHRVAGEDSYLLKVKTRNTRSLDRLLVEVLRTIPGVTRTHTTIVLAPIKEETYVRAARAPEEDGSLITPTLEDAPAPLRLARRMGRMPPSAVREILKVAEQPDVLSFAGGLPAPELFPVEAIAEAHAEVLARDGRAALQYSTTEGFGPLREWVVARLARPGIRVGVDQVLITNGSQQGIDLMARVLLDPGSVVAVENPSYLAALQTFSGCEVDFLPIESDDDGMDIDALEQAFTKHTPRLVYVVAEFSNPKGTTLSRERRQRLVRLCQAHRVPILEDDPYGELRFRGEAPPALAALDDAGLVVHLGTFSKTLAPGLRLGWLVGSKELVRAATIAKQSADLHTATLAQRAAAALLARFDYDAHLAELRRVYGERCLAMLSAIERHLPAGTRWTRPDGGLFIWAKLPEGISADEVFADALREKVAFVPGSAFFAEAPRREFLRLNYSNRPPELIEEGIARLGRVVRQRLS